MKTINEIFAAQDKHERPITYKRFEDIQTNISEYWFKNNFRFISQENKNGRAERTLLFHFN